MFLKWQQGVIPKNDRGWLDGTSSHLGSSLLGEPAICTVQNNDNALWDPLTQRFLTVNYKKKRILERMLTAVDTHIA